MTQQPKFVLQDRLPRERYSSVLHQSGVEPSLFVRSDGSAVSVNFVGDAFSSRVNLDCDIARALAAELLAAADAVEARRA